MKLLFVTPFLPSAGVSHAVSGTVYQWLRRIAEHHLIDLISFVDSSQDMSHQEALKEFCRRITPIHRRVSHPALLYRMLRYPSRPKMFWSFHDSRMSQLIQNQTADERYDLVQFEYSQMAQYGSAVNLQTPRLLVKHDVRSLLAWRAWQEHKHLAKILAWFEWMKVQSYEFEVCKQFNALVVLSEHNRNILHGYLPQMSIAYIPPGREVVPADPLRYRRPGRKILFFGAMFRQVNIDAVMFFYHQVLPRIHQLVPDALLYIVGGNPTEQILALGRNKDVIVTGFISDIDQYFSTCDVAIAPMRVGGGIMTKVLDTMAAGLPVVATSVANEGISAHHLKEIFIADDVDNFARFTVNLLQHGETRYKVGSAAQHFIKQNFSWPAIISRWETLYKEITGQK